MRQDINFFHQYQTQKTVKKSQNRYLYTILIVMVLVIGGTYFNNISKLTDIEEQIDALTMTLNDPEMQDRIKYSDEVFKKLEVLQGYNSSMSLLNQNVLSHDVITTQKIAMISSTIPADVVFGSLSMTNANIIISATSKTREAIAEVQHNLKQLPFIEDVVISAISGTEEFSFSLNCVAKEVE